MGAAVFVAGWRMQLQSMRNNPDWFLALILAPLQTVVFVTIFQHAGRDDLTSYGVLAPALIALWGLSLQTSGELITRERENGSLEGLLAAPGRFDLLMLGRTSVVTGLSLMAFVECWLVGWLLTGDLLAVAHPALFTAVVVATAAAMTGWAGVMASVFVLARSARTFQNSLSYPFYVLGGVLVPVALLPEWLQPLTRLVFLSWSSDLFRDSLAAQPVEDPLPRLVAIVVLGAAGFLLSHQLLHRALRRARTTGSLAHA
ncbi:ABC transporter permease [uncultured Ornithinimicrobium sp.]|uniref:ABC transporter permease n=1 Tax=uncultured Ornithinimicrobium sp. TaxID=259307 RepID=UPI00259A2A89|nr:ABC transporter permease [uncultured Ornithinimicrobium sp.]